jgi:nitrite reductase/ring-hydroxylating ferredoxin subunit
VPQLGVGLQIYCVSACVFRQTDAFCTHGHALLTEAYVDGALVECPMQGGTFDIASGKAVGQPS